MSLGAYPLIRSIFECVFTSSIARQSEQLSPTGEMVFPPPLLFLPFLLAQSMKVW